MKYRLPRLRPGAAPRFHRGDSTGCLVLHGFMASPAEVGWLSDYLAQKHHFTVYTPRLMGHGLAPEHMARMRWQDWYAQALDGYHLLRAQCATVYVVGHSMGGLLALLLAGAEAVEAVVCAAAPLTPPSRRMPYAHWLRLVLPYTQHPTAADLNDSIMAEQARRGEAITGRVHYAKWSTRAVYELYQLMRITAVHLPEVTAPLLVLSAAQDQTVLPQDALHIQQQVRSLHIETAVLPQGGHIVLQDVGREAAFAIIGEFLARQAAGPAGSD